MNFWNKHDLIVMNTREKIILLKEEFNKKNGNDIENYNKRLNSFLDRKLKKQSEIILKQQILLSMFFLYSQNRKV
ncbi:hypothetical protein J4456_04480 [Candidatus Pacearchaeota archaeon]|nr:hypothetical protein [Candidatus Pacearchaeota archaeon]